MPELPEVETIVRGLAARLPGRVVARVWWSGKPLRLARRPDVTGLRRAAHGARVVSVARRAKYILIGLERPAPAAPAAAVVLVHLGMSGRLRLEPAAAPRAPHTHVVFVLAGGDELRFVDPRRFGWVRAAATPDRLPEMAALGPDPLQALDAAGLAARLAGSRAPLKAFLLDQKQIAGLGNIYVCEALHRARLHPRTPARRARRHAAALLGAIQGALRAAIENRGTTLRDYVDEGGLAGLNQHALAVYDRAGRPCPACGAAVRRIVQSARSTFYCPRCQRW